MNSPASVDIDLSQIDEILDTIGSDAEALIPILRAIQDRFNYLPKTALRHVAETTHITPAAITGVSTFYPQFRHRPAGTHTINVCIGTACHVKGAETLYEAFRSYLEIPQGEDTDENRVFTVQKIACLGCCMLAPAVRIDEVTYGHVQVQKIPGVIRDFLESLQRVQDHGGKGRGSDRPPEGVIRLCLCSSCAAAGAEAVLEEFTRQVRALSIHAEVRTVACTGVSYEAPLVEVALADGRSFRYGRLKPRDARAVLLRHFRPKKIRRRIHARVSALLEKIYTDEAWEPITRYEVDLDNGPDSAFWTCQHRVVTEHSGSVTPVDIDDYIRHGGFEALSKVRKDLSPEEIIDFVEQSGLRGRGGGGFPTAEKWRHVASAPGPTKYIICNGDEGDPGAFMDRMILESFPYRVLEGMAITAHALNISEGYLYIRSEYPLALKRVREAIAKCCDRKLISDKAGGHDGLLRLEVQIGAGAFVCGEETALIAALEGRRGMPRFRPPFPSESGFRSCPTLISNVETFASIPWIIRNGASDFAELGTESSKGTKLFALAGKVVRGGLIEVPMGMPLRRIVEEIGGGIQDDKKLKAVQVGGPSGGCVPEWLCDTPVDYEELSEAGTMMGSGGMVVLDETDCMVDIARYFMVFTQDESCGKCTFCRIGTKQMLDILERLCNGQGTMKDIDRIEELGEMIQKGSLCGLGRTAPNPVLSTLKYFREEYEAHAEGRCPAGKCKALIRYTITDDCIGCTKCAQNCPVNAITPNPYNKHEIDAEECTRCDTCRKICPDGAIEIVSPP